MKSLLTQLSLETFVFDLKDELKNTPTLNNISHSNLADNKTLEITLNKTQNLNDVFTQLNHLNIQIVSMRNKANRLEELFMGVVDSHFHDGKMKDENKLNNGENHE